MPAPESTTPRLYLDEQIAPRWKEEIASGRPCKLFSPFVTGAVAEEVLLAATARRIELYTVFSAANFACESSSLDRIERLVRSGVAVLHMPRLHAKMLLVPGELVTIGSQNLTTGGTTNREASALLTDEASVATAERVTAEWAARGVPVTLPWIEAMRKRLLEVKGLFDAANRAAAELDEEAERCEKELIERDEKKKQNIKKLRRSAGALRRANPVPAKVCRFKPKVLPADFLRDDVRSGSSDDIFVPPLPKARATTTRVDASLLARGRRSLTRWRIGDTTTKLWDHFRYLCIVEDTGRLGWAR